MIFTRIHIDIYFYINRHRQLYIYIALHIYIEREIYTFTSHISIYVHMYTHQYSITIFLQQWWLLGVQELMHNCFSCDLFYLHYNRSFWCQPVATSVLGVSLRPFGRLSLRRLHPRRAARRPWAARGVRDVRGARGCGQFRWRGWWHCSEHELPAWGFYPWTLEQAAQMKKRESLEVMVEGNDELSVINETGLKVIKETNW